MGGSRLLLLPHHQLAQTPGRGEKGAPQAGLQQQKEQEEERHLGGESRGGEWGKRRGGLTLPVVFVVAHAGQRNHHGTVQGQDRSTQSPALPPPTLSEAVQLASQVERGEAQA